VGLVTGVKS